MFFFPALLTLKITISVYLQQHYIFPSLKLLWQELPAVYLFYAFYALLSCKHDSGLYIWGKAGTFSLKVAEY